MFLLAKHAENWDYGQGIISENDFEQKLYKKHFETYNRNWKPGPF